MPTGSKAAERRVRLKLAPRNARTPRVATTANQRGRVSRPCIHVDQVMGMHEHGAVWAVAHRSDWLPWISTSPSLHICVECCSENRPSLEDCHLWRICHVALMPALAVVWLLLWRSICRVRRSRTVLRMLLLLSGHLLHDASPL